jgi:hypothetical protein
MVASRSHSIQMICLILFFSFQAHAQSSVLRLKTGVSNISITSGDRIKGDNLKSMFNFTPTVLWDFPSFSSRLGFHYLMEFNSPFGLTPMSGIGLSWYYHLFGITTGYEISKDDVLFQKSRPGPYIYSGVTPLNVNLNKFDTTSSNSSDNYYFSAQVTDVSIGLGYDYPVLQNMTVSGEFVLRSGKTIETSKEKVEYTGWTMYFTLATTYF